MRTMPLSRTTRLLLLPALALVAACGGQDPSARTGGVPVGGVLVQLTGPGTTELRAGQLALARAGFESVVRADPERIDALNDLAVAYHLEGHSEAARQLLDEVVVRGTAREQQAALVNLADLYAGDGFLSAAQAHLEAAREIDPARAEPAWAQALLADARGDADAPRLAAEALRLDADGASRRSLVFATPEERAHFEALAAEAAGDRTAALARWRELRGGRVPSLGQAAARHLEEP
jgi:tetratricopeptide (TPR) repeat protein